MPTVNLESALDVKATAARVSDTEIIVDFEDGRTLSTPLAWYPRLSHGTRKELQNFEIGAMGIHWPSLDEDISYRGLLLGHKSGESSESLKFWLDARRDHRKVTLKELVESQRKTKR